VSDFKTFRLREPLSAEIRKMLNEPTFKPFEPDRDNARDREQLECSWNHQKLHNKRTYKHKDNTKMKRGEPCSPGMQQRGYDFAYPCLHMNEWIDNRDEWMTGMID